MKNFVVIFFLLTPMIFGITTYCREPLDYSFYTKVGSGISFSDSANINAHYPPWSPATEGYNSKLGNCPIVAFSIGCELSHVIDLEFNLSNRSIFKYRKCQNSTICNSSYTREFDLSVTPILFSANILGRGIPCLHKNIGSCGKIYPLIGAGVGSSDLLITNFRTTGLSPTGNSAPYESFTAENQYTLRKNFTYIALIGFEYSHNTRWAIGSGYRWFDAGCFKGPQYQRTTNGAAVDTACEAWNIRFRANEWFIEFKIFIG